MIYRGRVTEDSAAVLLARITKDDGTYPAVADISTIAIKSYDDDTGDQIKSGTATPATVIQSSPVADARWASDTIGANLILPLDGGYWPNAGTVRVQVGITPTSGNPYYIVWVLQVDEVLGS